jgi:DNA-binding NtrC family response regulator
MGPDLSHVTSSGRLPRLLIAESNLSTFEPLIRTLRDERLAIDFDVCTSHWNAVWKLLASPYQLIISGVHLAEMHDFLLVKRAQALQTFVPFVVTASASEKEVARRVLNHGAFDLILTPLDHEQTVNTIRLALWQNKLMELIARREKAFEQYRRHLDAYPGNRKMYETFLSSLQRMVSCFDQSIQAILIEGCIKSLADLARIVEQEAQAGALERLDSLPK